MHAVGADVVEVLDVWEPKKRMMPFGEANNPPCWRKYSPAATWDTRS